MAGIGKVFWVIVLNVWPILVVAALEVLSRLTSSYFLYATTFALAALCNIPTTYVYAMSRKTWAERLGVVAVFIPVQAIVLPPCLWMILSA